MFDWLKAKVLLWATAAAATLTGLQLFMPPMIDWLLDWLVVALVFIAAKVAKATHGKS